MSLAVNARDSMPSGGRLTISTDEIVVDREAGGSVPYQVQAGRYLRIGVSDTGTGMDEETLRQAFDPFFTTKAAGQGTGLGLATVYGIVTQSGGEVWVSSEFGEG